MRPIFVAVVPIGRVFQWLASMFRGVQAALWLTAWLGNTPQVALKHCLQVTDEHFQKALKDDAEAGGNVYKGSNGCTWIRTKDLRLIRATL